MCQRVLSEQRYEKVLEKGSEAGGINHYISITLQDPLTENQIKDEKARDGLQQEP